MSKIKKNSVKNKDNSYAKRLYTCGVIATGLFIIIIAHLAFIQFVEGKELSEKALSLPKWHCADFFDKFAVKVDDEGDSE